jgi:hypothetical protein
VLVVVGAEDDAGALEDGDEVDDVLPHFDLHDFHDIAVENDILAGESETEAEHAEVHEKDIVRGYHAQLRQQLQGD